MTGVGRSESSDSSHPFHYEQNPLLLQTCFILDKAGTFSQNSVELISSVLAGLAVNKSIAVRLTGIEHEYLQSKG
jgi:hypothetical protein